MPADNKLKDQDHTYNKNQYSNLTILDWTVFSQVSGFNKNRLVLFFSKSPGIFYYDIGGGSL
ncbi:MAG: hypothetical protein DRH26_06145 [Deltaproteobacteria bacterium]|nr:MAG: hypothetical protein DRH26_06145 [Deltaproteobacteria bacterium]